MRELIRNIAYYEKVPVAKINTKHQSVYQFIFVTQGELNLTSNDVDYTVRAPSIVIFNEYDTYNIKYVSEDYCRYIFCLDTLLADEFLDKNLLSMVKFRPLNYPNIYSLNQKEKTIILEIFRTLVMEATNEKVCGDAAVESLVSLMLIFLYRIYAEKSPKVLPERIVSVQKYIENHYDEHVNIDTISKKMFLSRSFLTHEFKKNTGYSIQEYLKILRLNHAEEMLLNSHSPIKQIAESCGYTDINNFNRHFKSKFNHSPLQYRKTFFTTN